MLCRNCELFIPPIEESIPVVVNDFTGNEMIEYIKNDTGYCMYFKHAMTGIDYCSKGR